MDIVQLKSLVTVVSALGNVGGKAAADGKVDMTDLVLITEVVGVLPLLVGVDFSQVVPEAKDLTAVEAEELVAHFKAAFDIPQDDIEVKVEGVLSICSKLASLVAEAIALFKPVAV